MSLADTGRSLVEEAKRLPWWGWLLVAAAVYFGWQLIGNIGSASSSSGTDTSGAPSSSGDTSGSPLIPPSYPPGQDPGSDPIPGTDGSHAPTAAEPSSPPHANPGPGETRSPVSSGEPRAPIASGIRSGKRSGSPKTAQTPPPPADPRAALQQQRQTAAEARGGTGGGPDSYVSRPGDTLSSIADQFGVDHETLYHSNVHVIEASARQQGLPHSDGGTWLSPGTRLEIPR